tara:strand:+ start:11814 stop:12035 length:222 start_codon:yes stop_codon:yes gene_type:complete
MFDKTIKIEVNGETVHLTNKQVTDLFTDRVKVNKLLTEAEDRAYRLAAERIVVNVRLENANAKLKEFGNPGQF